MFIGAQLRAKQITVKTSIFIVLRLARDCVATCLGVVEPKIDIENKRMYMQWV